MNTVVDPLPFLGVGVALRRLSASDLSDFQAYRTDADLGRYQGWSALSDADARAFLEEMNSVPLFRPGEWAQVAIAESERSALLGDVGLYLAKDAGHAEIGFTLARHAQGRGLATAAVRAAIQLVFAFTTAERVVGIADARNQASVAVLERVGMQKQAERSAVFRAESCIEYVYAVRRHDG